MKLFENDRDLYDYMLALAERLDRHHLKDLADSVRLASRHAASNMGVEFLGESRTALQRVLSEEHKLLSGEERADIADALQQVENTFERHRLDRK